MRRKFLASLAALGLPLFAQTKADYPSQIRGIITPNFADAEIPSGLVNGTNAAFTLLHTPVGSSLLLVRNGLVQQAGGDFTIAGSTVTFAAASVPQTGDSLQAWYRF